MRIVFLTGLLMVAASQESCSQTGDTDLFSEVRSLLEKNSRSVSTVLSDKKYLSLHPQTAFRELVKKHSQDSILTITTPDEPGKKIRVTGRITNESGQPVSNALIYVYQTDSKGWYAADAPHVGGNSGDFRQARLFGYVRSGPNGEFELHTVKPSGYPQSDLPAHIHVHVDADGYSPYVNEFLFDDDERLVGEIRKQSERNRFLIASPGKADAPFSQHFSYTVILR